jgi:hypothetical protein
MCFANDCSYLFEDSGHGDQSPNTTGSETDGRDES